MLRIRIASQSMCYVGRGTVAARLMAIALICFIMPFIRRSSSGQLGVHETGWFVIFIEVGPNCHGAIEQERKLLLNADLT